MKKRKKENRFIIIFLFIILPIYLIFGGKYENRLGFRNAKTFYESNFRGVVDYIGVRNQGTSFRLAGDSLEYVFFPQAISNKGNQDFIFYYFATPGDSIIKEAHSDTLILKKEGILYLYTFRKFFKNM